MRPVGRVVGRDANKDVARIQQGFRRPAAGHDLAQGTGQECRQGCGEDMARE